MSFFLTTAIDYVNSRPHLGTAYEKITADVIARYKRLAGVETRFLMGNDEHSQNVYRKARELGLDPNVYCDQMEREFREVWAKLSISFDDFIRTTEPRHRAAVQRMAQACYDAGDVYEGHYEGWYCVSCEAFKQEKDLVDGRCAIHLTTPEWIREKNHFFRLSKYQEPLLAHYAGHPGFIQPDIRRNEILRLVEGGLEDISISRAGQSWGIPLPFDPSSVVYVWFDALINYAAAVGYGTDEGLLTKWWPADLHVVGKDITRFHSVVWPAMLMSAGLALPRQVFGHGWVHFKGQKMSKSLGTVVDPLDAAERLGADPLRLYLVEGYPIRRRRRLLVGALRGAIQRRPRQQSRQPGQPDHDHGREVPGAAAARLAGRARPAGRRRRDCRGDVSCRDGPAGPSRSRRSGLRPGGRHQRVHCLVGALGPGSLAGPRGSVDRRVVRRGRGAADRRRAAPAGRANLGRRDPAARRRARQDGRPPPRRRTLEAGSRPYARQGAGPLAPARTDSPRGPQKSHTGDTRD